MSGSGSNIQVKEAMVRPELGVERPALQRTWTLQEVEWLLVRGTSEVLRGNGTQPRPTDTSGDRVAGDGNPSGPDSPPLRLTGWRGEA